MKDDEVAGVTGQSRTLALNALIVLGYIAIVIATHSPWAMLVGFLLLALGIRLTTLCWMMLGPRHQDPESTPTSIHFLVLNLVLGLLFIAGLTSGLWWLGRFWLSEVKVIVPIVAVFVAYKSTFPGPHPKQPREHPLDSPEDAPRPQLGKWGWMHLRSLGENQPETLAKMSRREWEAECREIHRQAEAMYQLLLKRGLHEDQAEEVILNDLVLVRALPTEDVSED